MRLALRRTLYATALLIDPAAPLFWRCGPGNPGPRCDGARKDTAFWTAAGGFPVSPFIEDEVTMVPSQPAITRLRDHW
jgi:hypothetical protein